MTMTILCLERLQDRAQEDSSSNKGDNDDTPSDEESQTTGVEPTVASTSREQERQERRTRQQEHGGSGHGGCSCGNGGGRHQDTTSVPDQAADKREVKKSHLRSTFISMHSQVISRERHIVIYQTTVRTTQYENQMEMR